MHMSLRHSPVFTTMDPQNLDKINSILDSDVEIREV